MVGGPDKNRALWDEWASFHLETPMYRRFIEKLEGGGHALLPLEVDELGSVEGLRTLHLQCHVGTDTLSLARLGADVVGVDFSPEAIEQARRLSDRLGIDAEFVCAPIERLPASCDVAFDLVFTSYGVINWLRDLDAWAAAIAQSLRPGGRFYIVDSHPIAFAIADRPNIAAGEFTMTYPYLAQDTAVEFEGMPSYADPERPTEHRSSVEWAHGLAEIVMAVKGADLQLEFVREHAAGYAPIVPGMTQDAGGHWWLPEPMNGKFPLTFSLSARR